LDCEIRLGGKETGRQADRHSSNMYFHLCIHVRTVQTYKCTCRFSTMYSALSIPNSNPRLQSRKLQPAESLFHKKKCRKGTDVGRYRARKKQKKRVQNEKQILPSIHESHLPYLPKYPRPSYVLLDIPRINPKLLERNPPKRKAGIGRNCNIPVPPIRKIDIVIFPLMPPKQMKKKSQGQKKKKRKSSQIAISHRSPRRPLLRRGSFTTPTNPKEPPQTHPAAPLFLFHRRRRRSRGRNTLSRRPVSIRIQRIVAADSPVG
jgi:hypothetical protein